MKKIWKNILSIEIIVVSVLTIINIFYTFQTMRFAVLSKTILIALAIVIFAFLIWLLISKFTKNIIKIIITLFVIVAYNIVLFLGNNVLFSYNGAMNLMGSSSKFTTYLVAKKDSPYESIKDIKEDTKIGIQARKNSYENGSMALEELQKLDKSGKITEYQSIENAYKALTTGKADIITVSNIDNLEKYDKEYKENFKVIGNFEVSDKIEDTNKDVLSHPFTILISGIDSRSTDIDGGGNGDANILVTFNPQTGHITTLTTPRDSFIPLACNGGARDKLTHAASYGQTKCVKETLETLYNIKVDYTVRINFVGVIDVVNALGGVDIDVPVNSTNASQGITKVCEQDSHGKKDTMCWEEGKVNHMDGETALAFSRNRYNQDGGDFYRGRNQQIVVDAILKKATSLNNITKINDLLGAISKHMRTNLDKNDIISLYEVLLNLPYGINIEKLYVGGEVGWEGDMSVVYPSEKDLTYADYRMRVNLNEAKPQFPTNGYYVDGARPSIDGGNNPLRQELMPFNGTIKSKADGNTNKTESTKATE